jgi:hypothetical protein
MPGTATLQAISVMARLRATLQSRKSRLNASVSIPYVEHGKMIGQHPEFLRKMDRRRKELVAARAEEAAATAAKETRITIVDA